MLLSSTQDELQIIKIITVAFILKFFLPFYLGFKSQRNTDSTFLAVPKPEQ